MLSGARVRAVGHEISYKNLAQLQVPVGSVSNFPEHVGKRVEEVEKLLRGAFEKYSRRTGKGKHFVQIFYWRVQIWNG